MIYISLFAHDFSGKSGHTFPIVLSRGSRQMRSREFLKTVWRGCLLSCIAFAVNTQVAAADASAIFKQLSGSWRGSGDITLTDGSRERISCRGYYVLKGRNGLSVAILCNSPNYKVELRSRLLEKARGVSGTWEERTFNAMGEVSGRATGNRLTLSIAGAVTGSISISLTGRRHTVKISTVGTGFKAVSISLVRG